MLNVYHVYVIIYVIKDVRQTMPEPIKIKVRACSLLELSQSCIFYYRFELFIILILF